MGSERPLFACGLGPLSPLQALPYSHKLLVIAVATLVSALWLRLTLAASRSSSPAARFAAAAPPFLVNCLIPCLLRRDTEAVSIAFSSFILTWLSNSKALALAAGRGPLAQQPWSPLQFWVLYALPIVPAASAPSSLPRRPSQAKLDSSPSQLVLRWLLKGGLTAGIVFGLLWEELPPVARSFLYAWGIYGMLGVVMDGPAALVLSPLRLDLAPHFLPPYNSTSLPDFWGARWNLAAGNSLRTLFYEPVVEGRLVRQPSKASTGKHGSKEAAGAASDAAAALATANGWDDSAKRRRSARLAAAADPAATAAAAAAPGAAASGGVNGRKAGRGSGLSSARLAGMTASFVASGLIHEAIFWYVHGSFTRRLGWLCFFSGQVPLILAERWLLARLKRAGVRLPVLVQRLVTLGVLLATAHPLFFSTAEAAGMPALFAASMRQSFAAIAAAPADLLAGLAGGRVA